MISSGNSFKLFKYINANESFKLFYKCICNKASKSVWNDPKVIQKLKELSFLEFTEESDCYKTLEKYAQIATEMEWVCTDDVEPFDTPAEYVPILTRDDVVNEECQQEQILKNALIVGKGGYFVAPRNYSSSQQMKLASKQSEDPTTKKCEQKTKDLKLVQSNEDSEQ